MKLQLGRQQQAQLREREREDLSCFWLCFASITVEAVTPVICRICSRSLQRPLFFTQSWSLASLPPSVLADWHVELDVSNSHAALLAAFFAA